MDIGFYLRCLLEFGRKVNRRLLIGLVLSFFLLSTSVFATLTDATFYYSYDDDDLSGSNPLDLSGNGNDGTNSGATTGVSGVINEAFEFDGSSNYVDAGVPFNNDFTIAMWINGDTIGATEGIFGYSNGGSDQVVAYFTSSSNLRFQLNGVNLDMTGWSNGQWYHLAMTFDDTTNNATIYRDGAYYKSATFTGSFTGGNVYLGKRSDGFPFDGDQDETVLYPNAKTAADIAELHNSGAGFNPYASVASPFFTVTAKDVDTSATLSNITVMLENGTTYTNASNSQVITPFNDSSLQNFTISVENYFNQTFTNYNTSVNLQVNLTQYAGIYVYNIFDNLSLNATLVVGNDTFYTNGDTAYVPYNDSRLVVVSGSNIISRNVTHNFSGYVDLNVSVNQVLLTVTAVDALSGSSIVNFSASIGSWSNSTTSGSLTLPANVGNYSITVSSTGYDSKSSDFSFVSGYDSLQFQLGKNITMSIFDETTGLPFPINTTNSAIFSVYCSDERYDLALNTSELNNSFEIQVCPWDFLRLELNYDDTSYFRTLVPAYSVLNVPWYMIDIEDYTAYQVLLKMNDLTGQFDDATLEINRILNGTEITLIEQYFDAESKVVLYLIKDEFYTITLRNSAGDVRNLGYLQADSAGTKTINIPDVSFVPGDIQLGNNIVRQWSGSSDLIRFVYNDSNVLPTTNLTFSVYNGSNVSDLLYESVQTNVATAVFTFTGDSNLSYKACFAANTPYLNYTVDECVIYAGATPVAQFNNTGSPSWDEEDEQNVFNWIFIVIVLIILFTVGIVSPGSALGLSAFILAMGYAWGWVLLGTDWATIVVIALAAVGALASFFVEVNR